MRVENNTIRQLNVKTFGAHGAIIIFLSLCIKTLFVIPRVDPISSASEIAGNHGIKMDIDVAVSNGKPKESGSPTGRLASSLVRERFLVKGTKM